MEGILSKQLIEYGILGVVLIIALIALHMTIKFIMQTFKKRMTEFYEREKACEERMDSISKRLDEYIDNDHDALIRALNSHTSAYEAQTRTLERLMEKMIV